MRKIASRSQNLMSILRSQMILSAIIFNAALFPNFSSAQEPISPELQAAIATAKAEAELANAQANKITAELNIVKAKQAAFEESLPKGNAKGLEGKITLDDVKIEVGLQTYGALNRTTTEIANKIVAKLPNPVGAGNNPSVVIRSNNDIAGLLALKSTRSQLKFMDAQFTAAFQPRPLIESVPLVLVPQLVASLLGSIGDVASFFKTDTDITGLDIAITKSAIVPNLAEVLTRGGVNVYSPELVPIDLLGTDDAGFKKLVAEFNKVGTHARRAKPVLDSFQKIQSLESKLAAEKDPLKKPAIETQLQTEQEKFKNFPYHNEELVVLSMAVNKLMNTLNETDSSGISNFVRLSSAADLSELLQAPNTHLLEISIHQAGGNAKRERKAFGSGKDYYSGGVVISYTLFDSVENDPKMKYLLSGIESKYMPYERPFKIMGTIKDTK